MSFLLPSPFKVFLRCFSLFSEGGFYITVLMSVTRVILGFLTGVIIGIILALLMNIGRPAYAIISPLLTVIKSTPVASFIILLWVFMPSGILPGIIGALVVIPIVAQNVYSGLANVDKSLVEVAKIYDFTTEKRLTYIIIPSVYPYFTSAALTSIGMAWKAGVAAEVLAYVKNSLGKEIFLAKSNLNTTDLFAYTLIVIILSLIIEKTIKHFIRKVNVKYAK
ncbi:MAG: ABC transporter permease subunit [Eubacteriales bacterium]|nr:ABC transporter permease subunit [Eubacteriales bacterium]